jgi:hypothetical protein
VALERSDTQDGGDRMKLLILTSCTGEKVVESPDQLTLDDFRRGATHVAEKEKALKPLLRSAEDLYSGLQHIRLMKGIRAAREAGKLDVELQVLSAGYGLVSSDTMLAPYEATFAGMKGQELREWARALHVPQAISKVLAQPHDLTILLLGEDYLKACELGDALILGAPTIALCSGASAKRLPDLPRLHKVVLTNADAKRFHCGMVGLKGEVASRVVTYLSRQKSNLTELLKDADHLLHIAEREREGLPAPAKAQESQNSQVDWVIKLPKSWQTRSSSKKLTYFIPDWDDQVDPDFDFATETHSGGTGEWSNQVYAHQMFKDPNYDGILISKIVAEQSKKKAERINRLGVHRHLRVPRDFPVMGDCGAFGYINEYAPPFNTQEILDYYTRLDFDYGVSIDHFAIGEGEDRQRRYELTIENARDFIVEHKKLGLGWTPIGAVQGWDETSFAKAAKQYAKMGYQYIAVGAMVRRRTPEILSIVEQVRKVIPAETRLHLFGVARLNAIADFARAGVNSADSASWLRKAWLGGAGNNYLAIDGQEYGAIRIPEAEKSFRAKRIVSEGRATLEQVKKLEQACIEAMHAFDRDHRSVESVLDTLHEYDQLVTAERQDNRRYLKRTLEVRPWKTCPCDICQTTGIDVVIFRGNNRNRRRGFHNTYAFYHLFQRVLAGEIVPGLSKDRGESQMSLALAPEEAD